MFSLFYNFCLFLLGILALPKLFWDYLVHKKYRQSLKSRLGYDLPPFSSPPSQPVIWIHNVSVGETRAIIPLYKKIQQEMPDATFIVSSVTETGHAEAKRSLATAKVHFYLPLDFSWIIKKVVKKYHPDLLLLVEGEFWYHLISETKKAGTPVILVNGKISERSAKRFGHLSFFAKRLFSQIDQFCVQSERLKERFLKLGVPDHKIQVAGNLKLDLIPSPPTPHQISQFKQDLGILPQDRILVIGSTHEGEEAPLLDILKSVWEKTPELKVLLVPRHPERFSQVAKLLQEKKIPYFPYSQKEKRSGSEQLILIDAMGILPQCYPLADLAIVAGSFTDKVGGHNIFEPIACGVPVLFGPHMFSQLDFRELVLNAHAGKEVQLEELSSLLIQFFQNSPESQSLHRHAQTLSQETHNVSKKTWDAIFPFLLNRK